MATIEEETFTTVTKDPVVRDRMIRAMHRHSHEHGYLWEPTPGCGCEERIDILLSDWDDEECDDCGSTDNQHDTEVEH